MSSIRLARLIGRYTVSNLGNLRFPINSSQLQLYSTKPTEPPLPPITDDQSTVHLKKPSTPLSKPVPNSSQPSPLNEPPNPQYKKRSPLFRFIRGVKIVTFTGIGLFGLAAGYVIITEYLEDKKQFRKDLPSNQDFELKQDGDKLLAKWPTSEFELDQQGRTKPKIIVVGSGWGALGILKNLDVDAYQVLVISPRNYFLFTPLLPSVTVGTLEVRSLLEPIRKVLRRFKKAFYFKGKVLDVDICSKMVMFQGEDGQDVWIEYDKLVVAVGAQPITFGIDGLEKTFKLHSINDARIIRKTLFDKLELAYLPTTSKEKKKQLLSFVVCGGGPTGVEFAAELEDFLSTDLTTYFPSLIEDISITIVQSRSHILNTYDEKLSLYAEKLFKERQMQLITDARVLKVNDDSVLIQIKNEEGKKIQVEIPAGMVLWSTGISMVPLTAVLSKKLQKQDRLRALTVDSYLRVKGAEDKGVYAVGDCASVEVPKLIDHIVQFFESADTNHDGQLDLKEFETLLDSLVKKVPQASAYRYKLEKLFEEYDADHSNSLDLQEIEKLIKDIDRSMTSLPATAQVANQEAKYLADNFNKLALLPTPPPGHENETIDEVKAGLKPFTYLHLGSLAYLGNSAVAEFNTNVPWSPKVVLAGFSAMYLWRSIYWSEQVSLRTRLLLSLDWTKRVLFGRDLSKV